MGAMYSDEPSTSGGTRGGGLPRPPLSIQGEGSSVAVDQVVEQVRGRSLVSMLLCLSTLDKGKGVVTPELAQRFEMGETLKAREGVSALEKTPDPTSPLDRFKPD